MRAVAAGRADIGIVADTVDPAAGLETFPFAENFLVLVVPRGYALGRHRRINSDAALQHDFVDLGAGSLRLNSLLTSKPGVPVGD